MSQGHHHRDPTVPKPLLWIIAAMVAFTIAVSAWSGYQKRQQAAARDQAIAELVAVGEQKVRQLAFEDQSNGGIAVLDGRTRSRITAVEPKEDGFVRGVLRGFARERRAKGIGPQPPFDLILTAEGGLILSDPETGREVFLNAFGPTNAQAFGRLFFAGRDA